MNSDHTPDTASPNRRLLVAGLGVGACAAAVGILRWSSSTPAIGTAAPSVATAKAKDVAAVSSAAEEIPASIALPEHLSRESFLSQLNTGFEMAAPESGSFEMKLIQVSEASTLKSPTTTYQGFSLLFDGPMGSGPVEGTIYHVRNAALGEMDLFLSPVGKPGDRLRLEAVFTRKV